jgi:hypothetical protein
MRKPHIGTRNVAIFCGAVDFDSARVLVQRPAIEVRRLLKLCEPFVDRNVAICAALDSPSHSLWRSDASPSARRGRSARERGTEGGCVAEARCYAAFRRDRIRAARSWRGRGDWVAMRR